MLTGKQAFDGKCFETVLKNNEDLNIKLDGPLF